MGQPDRIKIVYVITDLVLGGAQRVLLDLVSNLDKGRYQPVVICLRGEDTPVNKEFRDKNVPVFNLGMSSWWRLDAFHRFYRLLKREKPVIIHSSLFHANMTARLIGRIARVPIIVTWRHNIHLGGVLREKLNNLSNVLDDHVVAVSDSTRQAEVEGSRIESEKVTTIYNGIDADRFIRGNQLSRARIRGDFGIQEEGFLIGSIGRLHPQKGWEFLMDAISKVRREFPHLRVIVIGEGELLNTLLAKAKSIGVGDTIIFAGARVDIPEILNALDLFILPSLWEGLPIVILEAMAASLPVVATTVGGIPEVIIDGETGFLVPPGNSAGLEKAIIKLINQEALRYEMGNAGRKRIQEHFTIQQTESKITKLYDDLLNLKGISVCH